MFGISGAQRTGKTTLAKAVAEKLKFHYHDSSVTKIMREFGINPVGDVPLGERIKAQEFLLEKSCDALRQAPRPAITDRTPLDFIAYMLGEVTMHNTAEEFHEPIQTYVKNCLAAAEKYFDMILIVRPLLTYKAADDKPPPNRAYQSAIQYLIEGAAQNIPNIVVGLLPALDLTERVDNCSVAFSTHLEEVAAETACWTKH